MRFHDGSPMTADDVVFSIERALAKTSQRSFQLRGVTGAKKVDESTIDILLAAPDAVLPEKLIQVGDHEPRVGDEAQRRCCRRTTTRSRKRYAVRNANGTGPYMLKSYEPDNRVVLVANPHWWGKRGNVDEAIYTVIQSDATRLAALASGQVDFVVDPPFQDVAAAQVAKAASSSRRRPTSARSTSASTRRATSCSSPTSRGAIRSRTCACGARSTTRSTSTRSSPRCCADRRRPPARTSRALVDGYVPELEKRLPYDPSAARALLKDAGYADGFGVTLDCVNIAFRAAVCQAIAGMLAQVGIRVDVPAVPDGARSFPKLTQASSSFFEFGWTPTHRCVGDAERDRAQLHRRRAGRLQRRPLLEPEARCAGRRACASSPTSRSAAAWSATRCASSHADLPLIPLYRRTLTWVMRPNVDVAQWPNDILELRFVQVD